MTQTLASPARTFVDRGAFSLRQVGDFEVFGLADGEQDLSLSLFGDADPAEARRLAAAAGFDGDAVPIAVNCFAVRAGDRLILVDTGAGIYRGDRLGQLPDSMAKAGLDPLAVDIVLMTHLHGDHAGGLQDPAGGRAFPNAELWLAEPEAAFWLQDGLADRLPDRMRPTVANAISALEAYRGSIVRFEEGSALAPGLVTVPLPGHTPGQTGLLIESGDDRLFIWADIIHATSVQFARPDWTIAFDVDGAQAAKTRESTFARCVIEDLPVAGMHLAFPGFGRVRQEADAYRFEPSLAL